MEWRRDFASNLPTHAGGGVGYYAGGKGEEMAVVIVEGLEL